MELKNIIYEHLLALSRSQQIYFPSLLTTKIRWVVSLHGGENIKNADFTFTEKERLQEVSSYPIVIQIV